MLNRDFVKKAYSQVRFVTIQQNLYLKKTTKLFTYLHNGMI